MKVFSQKLIRQFAQSEAGSMTALSMVLLVPLLLLAGYAIDTGNVMASRTQLQITADATAHAALLKREFFTEAEAKQTALQVAALNMPSTVFGAVVGADDIEFGTWDHLSGTFVANHTSRSAVRVTAHRLQANGNAVQTFLLKFVGLTEWNLNQTSIFTTYNPTCLREGFVAEQMVDLQSNNNFSNGFCIHSNSYVSLNSNNYFEPGTVVSMANLDDLELPNSGFRTNTGLQDALREGSWNIRIISRIDAIITGLKTFDNRYLPAYITSTIPVNLPTRNVAQANLIEGRVHRFTCNGGAALTIKNGVTVHNAVIVTDCKVKFEAGVILDNAVIATTSPDAHSMTASAGLQVGKNDNCATGGGAELVTLGSMDFPSDLKVYGGQLLALHDISFAANANGIQGAAFAAGGEISGTSNMAMGFCGSGMEASFQAEYFKLVL